MHEEPFVLRPSLENFEGKLSKADQKRLRDTSKGMYTKQRLPDGRVRVTGGKRLKASGAYTASFGKQVAKLLWKQKMRVPWLCVGVGRNMHTPTHIHFKCAYICSKKTCKTCTCIMHIYVNKILLCHFPTAYLSSPRPMLGSGTWPATWQLVPIVAVGLILVCNLEVESH